MAGRPNILVLMTDQQKATALRMYHPEIGVPAPALERLAAHGTRYDQCYTPHPLCVPARVSFWTGRYPHRHGSRTNEIPMPPGETHLARVLHDAGYALALFGKDHCFREADHALFAERYAFSHAGPDETENEREAAVVRWIRSGEPGLEGDAEGWDATAHGRPRINPYAAGDCPTAILARRATWFSEAHETTGGPFCAWVSFPDPHEPYQCPLPYAALHPPDALALPPWREGEAADNMEKDATPWSYRDAKWAEVIVGVSPDPADNARMTAWARGYWEALHPYSAGGAYVNFMMEEGEERIRATYGENYNRLASVKAAYDPTNLFRVNQNIAPK